jgi:TolA-binding protein
MKRNCCLQPFVKFICGFNRIKILIAVFPLLAGCAYFNTCYNAETAFNQGYKAHQKVLKNFPDSILVAAPLEAKTSYERAIQKSLKVAEVYPKDIKYHDDALYVLARSYLYNGDLQKAISCFAQLQQDYSSSIYIPDSYIYLAMAYIQDGDLDKAEDKLQFALSHYPSIDKNKKVSLLLVEIAIRREGKSLAIELLEKVLKSSHSEEQRMDLILKISALYIGMGQYSKAIPLLKSAPRKKDFPYQSYRLDMALLVSYIEIDSLDIALKFCDNLLKNKMYYPNHDEILFEKGIIYEKMGKIDEAIATLLKITSEMDSAKIASDSSKVTGKAFYKLGFLYQKKKEDYKTAEKYFLNASKVKDTSITAPASRRIKAMALLKTLRGDTTDSLPRYIRNYKIGELFRFELEEPDSAYKQFLEISKDKSADPQTVPRSLCVAALIARDDLRDTVHADSLLKYIMNTFPASEFARRAQEELKLPLTVKTQRDSAQELFIKAERLYYDDQKLVEAVQAYYDVYKKYPKLDIAPKSLYVAAWISDAELQKHVTAMKLYKKICEKYPDSDYCTKEAKPRVKFVEDTLAAIKAANKMHSTDANVKPSNVKSSQDSVSKANVEKTIQNSQSHIVPETDLIEQVGKDTLSEKTSGTNGNVNSEDDLDKTSRDDQKP